MMLAEKKSNKFYLLTIAVILTLFLSLFLNKPASAATYTNDNSDSSFYFYKGGNAVYWHNGTCSLCVNGSYIYTGNTTNTIGNYAYWYFRGTSGYYNMAANVPNAIGATTTNAIYWLYETSSSSNPIGMSVNQMAIGGWATFYSSRWISNGGFIELTDKTLESSGTKNVGFDALRWSN